MFTKLRLLFLAITLILVAGCGPNKVSLTDKPRLLHFSTPETSGGWGNASASISSSFLEPEYTFGTLSFSAFDPNNLTINEEYGGKDDGTLNLSLWVGLLERLDFYLDSKTIVGLKYQLLGSPQTSKEKGLKLTFAAQFGLIRNNNRTDVFASNDNISHADSTTKLLDFSSNVGYRYNSKNLVYLNTFLNRSSFSGRLYADNFGLSRSVTESSKSFGFLMGYQYTTDSDTFLILELGITRTIWDNRGVATATPAGISYGGNWKTLFLFNASSTLIHH